MSRYEEIDLRKIKTISIKTRDSKVNLKNFGQIVKAGSDFKTFLSSLPDCLAAGKFKLLVYKIAEAVERKKPVLVMMGAHVIKTGLSPIIIDLMKSGIISSVAMNSAGVIHDTELAVFGETSEDVAEMLKDGRFGMVKETADLINFTVCDAVKKEQGFGEAMGECLSQSYPKTKKISILAAGWDLGIPITIHAALGTDIVHQHPSADGAAIGACSMRDFRIWTKQVAGLDDGGVLLLFGSAVLLPEVFLKSLTIARNIYGQVENFTTASFDMIQQYRPRVNVIERPNADNGTGINITGHHELMIPLLAAAINERCLIR